MDSMIIGAIYSILGTVTLWVFKPLLSYIRSLVKAEVKMLKDSAKKTSIKQFLSTSIHFLPIIVSLGSLVSMYFNSPIEIIRLIFISFFISAILWNIALVVLMKNLEELSNDVNETSQGLIKLTKDLVEAKNESKKAIAEAKETADFVFAMMHYNGHI